MSGVNGVNGVSGSGTGFGNPDQRVDAGGGAAELVFAICFLSCFLGPPLYCMAKELVKGCFTSSIPEGVGGGGDDDIEIDIEIDFEMVVRQDDEHTPPRLTKPGPDTVSIVTLCEEGASTRIPKEIQSELLALWTQVKSKFPAIKKGSLDDLLKKDSCSVEELRDEMRGYLTQSTMKFACIVEDDLLENCLETEEGFRHPFKRTPVTPADIKKDKDLDTLIKYAYCICKAGPELAKRFMETEPTEEAVSGKINYDWVLRFKEFVESNTQDDEAEDGFGFPKSELARNGAPVSPEVDAANAVNETTFASRVSA